MQKNFPLKKNDLFFLDEITSLCTEKDSEENLYIVEKKAKTYLKKLAQFGFFQEKINYQLGYVIEENQAYLVAKPVGNVKDEEFKNNFLQQIKTFLEDLEFVSEASKTDSPPINLIDKTNLQQDLHLKGGAKKINNNTIFKDSDHLVRLENIQKELKKENLTFFGQSFTSIGKSGAELIKKTSSEENVLVDLFLASVENWNTRKLPQLKFWFSAESVGVVRPSVSFSFNQNDSFGDKTFEDFVLMLCLEPSKRPCIKVLANVFKKYDLKKDDIVRLIVEVTDGRGGELEGESSRSEALSLRVTDRSGLLNAITELDKNSVRQLDAIIEKELGIGDSK